MSDNELDNLFKEAADGFKPPNDPSAWADMSRKLDQAGVGASIWNWKTISSTVVVGVAVVATILYVSTSTPVKDSNFETISSSPDASPIQDAEKKAAHKASENNPEINSAAQSTGQENDLAAKEKDQQTTEKLSSEDSKSSNEASAQKSNAVQSKNLNAPPAAASQQKKSTSAKALDDQNESGMTSSSLSRKDEIKRDDRKTTSAAFAGVTVTEKLAAPSNAVGSTSNEINAKQSSLDAKNSKTQLMPANTENTEAPAKAIVAEKVSEPANSDNVFSDNSIQPVSNTKDEKTQSESRNAQQKSGDGKSETLAAVVVAGKTVEPASSGNVVSAEISNSNQVAPITRSRDTRTNPIAVDSLKKSGEENAEALGKVAITEKVTDQTGSGATLSGESSSKQSPSSAKGTKGQSVVAGDSLRKTDELEKETSSEKISDKAEPEVKEEKPAFNRLAIKLAVAPDYTTVESATPKGLGINYGVLLEYRITNHWSVATGGIWSKKIYSAYDVEYSGYNADWVDGDCRMWDIPINVYYNFTSKKAFSFYASVGLSSYIMNEENYVYYFETPRGTYDYPMQVKGENNEWFKTLNVSAGIQFNIRKQFSLQFEPTLKAPLAGVGEGEVSLVSLGAFINLRYEIPFNKSKRDEE
ncbi:MAG TPA: outer membrane beta-barrel protein [Cyclobacteriaceae bacterium]|nr:outer membrane beta-barrel protein [Cyclobacteriaceae bacterium]